MKRAVFAVLVCLLMNASLAFAASREAQWKEVEEAVKKGLPKTAIEKLEPIIRGALNDKAWGEATKAIARELSISERTVDWHLMKARRALAASTRTEAVVRALKLGFLN